MAYYGFSFCDLFYYFQDIKFDDVQIMKMKGPHVTAMELIPKNAQIIQILALVASIFMKGATKFQAVFVQIYGTKMTWNFFAINTAENALIDEEETLLERQP